jgi:hypothetical protein
MPLTERRGKNIAEVAVVLAALAAVPAWTAERVPECQRDDSRQDCKSTSDETVIARYAGYKSNIPPFVTRYFDVTIKNEASEPRWFLLPSSLTQSRLAKGGIDAVELWKLTGTGNVMVADFLGTGGFQALLLPPHAQVTLKRFPIKSYEEPRLTGAIKLEVAIASSILLGSEPAEKWIGRSLGSDREATVDADKGQRAGSKLTPDNKELPVAWAETGRVSSIVEITPR